MRYFTFLLGATALLAMIGATTGCGGGGGTGMPMNLSAPGSSGGSGGDTTAAAVQTLVQGRIVFSGQESVSLSDAMVDIHLVDSSGSGQSARLVAGQRIHDVSYEDSAAGTGLPFEISGRKSAPDGVYFVTVRIDTDGDGKMGSGDYRSQDTRLSPADLSHSPAQVTVAVEKIP